MIVQCPECSSQYRVDDSKIPDSGGKISCPQCGNQFVVHPDDDEEEQSGRGGPRDRPDPDSTEVADRGRLQQMAAQYDDDDLDDPGGGEDEDEEDATYVMSPDELPSELAGEEGDEGDDEFPDDPIAQEGTVEMQSPLEGGEDVLDAISDDDTTDSISADDVPDAGDDWGPGGGEESAPSEGGGTRAGMGADPLGAIDGGEGQEGAEGSEERRAAVPDEPTMETEGADIGSGQATMEQDAPEPPSQPSGAGATTEQDAPSPPTQEPAGASGGGMGGTTPGDQGDDQAPPGSGGQSAVGGPGGGGAASSGGQPAVGGPGGGGAASAGGPPADHDGPWKLKAEHGLTYEFPETDALRDWLRDRDGVDSFELSADGSTFYPLLDWPQVADLVGGEGNGGTGGGPSRPGAGPAGPAGADAPGAGGGAAEPSGRGAGPPGGGGSGGGVGGSPAGGGDFGGGGDFTSGGPQGGQAGRAGAGDGAQGPPGGGGAPQSGSAPRPDSRQPSATGGDFELPSEDDDQNEAVLYVIFVILLFIAVGVGLDVSGTFPVGRYIPGVPTSFEETGEAAVVAGGGSEAKNQPAKTGQKQKQKGNGDDAQVERVLEAARKSLDENRLQSAKEELNAAKLLDPKRVEIYEMLATVHEKLGKKKKAEKNRKRARELKKKQADKPAEGGAKGKKGAAAEPDAGQKPPTN